MYFVNPEHAVAQFGLKPGEKVVDLGTGIGHYAIASAKAVEISGKVYAVDIQEHLLKELVNKARSEVLANIVPIHADIELPGGTGIESDSLDAALIANALFHIEEKVAFLREAYRILRPGGRILVVDWSDSFEGLGPSKEFVVYEENLVDLMQEVGFSLEGEIDAGAHHYGLIFKK